MPKTVMYGETKVETRPVLLTGESQDNASKRRSNGANERLVTSINRVCRDAVAVALLSSHWQ